MLEPQSLLIDWLTALVKSLIISTLHQHLSGTVSFTENSVFCSHLIEDIVKRSAQWSM